MRFETVPTNAHIFKVFLLKVTTIKIISILIYSSVRLKPNPGPISAWKNFTIDKDFEPTPNGTTNFHQYCFSLIIGSVLFFFSRII